MEIDLKYLEEVFHKHNLKITPQRIAIYKELVNSKEHPSAMIIYERIKKIYPNVSLDTVNRTLLTFSEIGLVRIVEGRGDPKRFDPNLRQHHHFRCIKCGEIYDFYSEEYDSLDIPSELKKKFIITSKRVNLEGICDRCRAKRG
ncbi:MAG: transcriptional repressor [Calditrichaeota bacterium]|nr:transcriptional repressor [Calditrichota bacterium]